MNGLTARQAAALARIVRCPDCGVWLMLTGPQHRGHAPITCPHLNPDALESDAA